MQDRLQRLINTSLEQDAEIDRLTVERDKARDAHASLCPYNAALASPHHLRDILTTRITNDNTHGTTS